MKLPWLASHLSPAPARYLGLAEYVTGALLGDESASPSMASGTGLLELATARWDSQALELAGVDEGGPCRPSPAAGRAGSGRGARRWPALAETTWHPATGDRAASNVGAGCVTPDQVAINIGTSAAIRAVEPADQAGPPCCSSGATWSTTTGWSPGPRSRGPATCTPGCAR